MHNNFSLWRPKCFEKCFISPPLITPKTLSKKRWQSHYSATGNCVPRATQKPLADTVPARTAAPLPLSHSVCWLPWARKRQCCVRQRQGGRKIFSEVPENWFVEFWTTRSVFGFCGGFCFFLTPAIFEWAFISFLTDTKNRSSLQNIVIPEKKKKNQRNGENLPKGKNTQCFCWKMDQVERPTNDTGLSIHYTLKGFFFLIHLLHGKMNVAQYIRLSFAFRSSVRFRDSKFWTCRAEINPSESNGKGEKNGTSQVFSSYFGVLHQDGSYEMLRHFLSKILYLQQLTEMAIDAFTRNF